MNLVNKIIMTTIIAFAFVSSGFAVSGPYSCSTIDECNDIIENIAIDGDIVKLTSNITVSDGKTIKISNKNNITFNCMGNSISNMNLSDTTSKGIRILDSSNIVVKNCLISNFEKGIKLSNATSSKILTNSIIDSFNYGIYLEESNDNIIRENNVLSTTNNECIRVKMNSNMNTIKGNYITNCADNGLRLSGGVDNVIIENIIEDVVVYGVKVQDTNYNTINQNMIENCRDGLMLDNASGNQVKENEISNNDRYGIYVVDSDLNDIIDNNLVRNGKDGIYLMNSNANSINNNYAESNLNDGIRLEESSNNIVSDNIASFNARNGIKEKLSQYNRITNNEAEFNDNMGFLFENSTISRINDNVATFNDNKGFKIVNSAHFDFVSNMADKNTNTGFYVENSEDMRISQNTAKLTFNFDGLTVKGSDRVSILKNDFIRNDAYGFRVANTTRLVTRLNAFDNNGADDFKIE